MVLSDVTIINAKGENLMELQDMLQVDAHALLRRKRISFQPKLILVHQNVDALAAETNGKRQKLN